MNQLYCPSTPHFPASFEPTPVRLSFFPYRETLIKVSCVLQIPTPTSSSTSLPPSFNGLTVPSIPEEILHSRTLGFLLVCLFVFPGLCTCSFLLWNAPIPARLSFGFHSVSQRGFHDYSVFSLFPFLAFFISLLMT